MEWTEQRLRHPWLIRSLAVVAIGALQVGGTYGAVNEQPAARPIDGLTIALLVLGPILLGVLWARPVAAMTSVFVVTLVYFAIGCPYGPFVLAPLVSLAMVANDGQGRLAAGVGAGGLVAGIALHQISPHPEGMRWTSLLEGVMWGGVVVVGAGLVRARRDRRAAAEIVRRETAERLASEERLRIARELHDVLAHDISLISVQAGVGLHLLDADPEQARAALATIKEASKDALTELRAALDLLRTGGVDSREPAGGLAEVDALAARLQSPGLRVTVERRGAVRPVSPATDLAAFRIVQEALTNVVRHSVGATRATIVLDYSAPTLEISIADDGSGAPVSSSGSGSGVAGMRERARALGGVVDAGPSTSGGFVVHASLPGVGLTEGETIG